MLHHDLAADAEAERLRAQYGKPEQDGGVGDDDADRQGEHRQNRMIVARGAPERAFPIAPDRLPGMPLGHDLG